VRAWIAIATSRQAGLARRSMPDDIKLIIGLGLLATVLAVLVFVL
jgi:hypothetical protein